MAGDIVNFNKAKKAAARHAKVKRAANNRVKYGASKPQKERAAALTEKLQAKLNAHKLDTPPENTNPDDTASKDDA
ncbi:hypothetical protein GCM10011309_08250 [Litorimonas cladophorae]|uniref:DUF4169 domain-containing protein n=1 Tax=Litorimonas cladophorae TaxID=1220491 RepID=A0A918KEH6_9PROT|nr:DUF4169 family protein [Litorimonas cladophorae]GGX60766.1 hypothetical protein GCM10011309_08250 [Litorimonas cladophorae]